MCFLKVRVLSLLWILMMAPLLWAQSLVTTVLDRGGQYAVIEVFWGSGSGSSFAAGGDIDPGDPEGVIRHEVHGFFEAAMAGKILLSFIVEEGDDIELNDPEGFIVEEGDDIELNDPEGIVIRTATTNGRSTFIVEQVMDLNEPEGLMAGTIVIHSLPDLPSAETIIEQGNKLDPYDPESLLAAEAAGAMVQRMLVGHTNVITVIDPMASGSSLLIHVFHTRF